MENMTFRLNDKVLFQKVVDETVILEPETGQYFTLDAIGTFMLEQIQAGLTLVEVTNKVISTYDVQKPKAEQDLRNLITEMQRSGLVVAVAING